MSKTYCIKSGYKPNTQALTIELDNPGSYWTPARIRASSQFQFYVYKLARDLMQKHQLNNLLDVGSGPPVKIKKHIWPLCKDITIVDQPTVAPLAKNILPEATFLGMDLEKPRSLNKQFDLIICADVLEHLLDPDPCLTWIYSSLRPNGIAIFSTPERDILRGIHCNHSPKPEHIREWNQLEFACYIRSHKLQIMQQLLTPQKKLPFLTELVWRRLNNITQIKKWSGCQIVVATKSR
ncbi:MAG: hypothetical protein CUN55_14140 [Phototrophicales bacterium]|nr:MAG: hypothetical protein CUN55_14140 [Phototrophicales bacterium]